MDKLEKLTKEIFDECQKDGEPVTMEWARQMAEMEIKAKGVNLGAREKAPKSEDAPKKPRTTKVSDEKKELFNTILQNLTRAIGVESENITVLTENKLIQVKIGDKTFKIDVVESRNKAK
jgi:hypothetical protein